ncbi:hypothetical protein DFQ28_000322 [Apophysomyces sp. BC1034]|nr:hypothetical protein DFQ28_000322 [Apophysomyces sp. BC1034]
MQFPLAFAETIHHADGDERMVALSDHNEFPPLLSAKPDGDEWHWVRKQELKEEPMNVHLADDNWEYVTYEVSKPLYAEVAERAAHLPSAPRRRPMKEQAGLRRRRQRIQLFEMQDDHDLGEEMWAVYKSAKMRRRRYEVGSYNVETG